MMMEFDSLTVFLLLVLAALAGLAITETGRLWLRGIVTAAGAARRSLGHRAARGDLERVKAMIEADLKSADPLFQRTPAQWAEASFRKKQPELCEEIIGLLGHETRL